MNSPIGKQIGNYRLTAEIASGGFGTVYQGQHIVFTDRPAVAIKLLHAAYLGSSQEAESFLQEARFLEKLKHPYCLSILDAGIHEGVPYLVTEYATNGSLRTRLKQQSPHPLPVEEALTILSQIGQALEYAHHLNIVHRDLKPDNILFNARGEALLADFGIAAVLRTSSMRQADATGTPAYMAPEQFRGKISKESDQYSLGCIAYELFTGSQPFTAPDFVAMGFLHVSEMPVPPTHLNPQLPLHIEQAILKAMAKERADRYRDVSAFIQALRVSSLSESDLPTVLASPSHPVSPDAATVRNESEQPTQLATAVSQSSIPAELNYTYQGHSGPVVTVAWSPDGTRIASGSTDKTIQVWQPITGKTLYAYRGHSDEVQAVAWSPDGRRIASASDDQTVQVWDAATGKTFLTYRGHSAVVALAWSPDGRRIASGSDDNTVQVWNATNGGNVHTYRGHSERVTAVAWSPDSRHLASGDWLGNVHVWEAATGMRLVTYVVTYGGDALPIYELVWSPDGTRITSSGYNIRDKTVQVWEAATGTKLVTYDDKLVMSPDGGRIAVGRDGGIHVWNAVTGQALLTYGQGKFPIVWSPDGGRIASVMLGDNNTAQVWQAP